MRKTLFSVAILGGMLIGQAAAQPITLDFTAYPAGTPLTSVSIPGVTFLPSPGVTATVRSANSIQISQTVAGADLRIKLARQALSSSFTTMGWGSCQVPGKDSLEWRNMGAVSATGTTYRVLDGRCFDRSFTQAAAHDELVIDIAEGVTDRLWIDDIQFNLVAAPTPVPASSNLTLVLMAAMIAAACWLRLKRRSQA